MLAFLDTEFTDFIGQRLISLGLACEDGSEFYVELDDFPLNLCTDFVKTVVLPLRTGPVMSEWQAALALSKFLEERPGLAVVIDYGGDYHLLHRLLDNVAMPCPPYKHLNSMFNPCDPDQFNGHAASLDWYFSNIDRRQHHALVDARAALFAAKQSCLL